MRIIRDDQYLKFEILNYDLFMADGMSCMADGMSFNIIPYRTKQKKETNKTFF